VGAQHPHSHPHPDPPQRGGRKILLWGPSVPEPQTRGGAPGPQIKGAAHHLKGEALPLGILKGEALKAGGGCAAPTFLSPPRPSPEGRE